jgi:hypothetical protein
MDTRRTAAGKAGLFNPEEHRSSLFRTFGPSPCYGKKGYAKFLI